MNHRTTLIGLWITVVFLAGCSENGPESMLEDYRDRVANVLDVDVAPPAAIHFSSFPQKRDRVWPSKEFRSGLLDAMDFTTCDLLPLIVERNSSLGKVMQPSKVLSYEIRFFSKLLLCRQMLQAGELQADDKTVELIEALYRNKKENLNAAIWNGFFSSDEVTAQFSNSKGPIPLAGNPGAQDSLRALNYFILLTEQANRFNQQQSFSIPNEFSHHGEHYFSLYGSEYGGQLQSSLILLINNLQQTTDLINLRLDDRPLCFNNKSNQKADILMHVFTRYYAAKVQPYMSLVHQQGQPWFNAMNSLLSFGGQQRPILMQEFQASAYDPSSPTSYWQQYQTALKAHTKAWQRVLGQCGLMPK